MTSTGEIDGQTNRRPLQFSVTISNSTTEVIAEPGNSQYLVLYIKNVSTGGQIISLGLGQDAVANTGVVLSPGESVQWSRDGAYQPPQERISAIGSAADGVLAVYAEMI